MLQRHRHRLVDRVLAPPAPGAHDGRQGALGILRVPPWLQPWSQRRTKMGGSVGGRLPGA
ncbi:hypothetical protein [Streptomyces venezuelae]|uniref:hypothetical protein n=1 Tax=Streptomyces venezuelae TaxID=54571 RepID=UPI001239FDF2|nr:hypothetical protein [Streptomyces venezuelae]